MDNTKSLNLELIDTSTIISQKFSNMKTTGKAFIAFFEELCKIEKNYAESLLNLTKTTGDKIGLKASLNGCREFENPTVQILIDNTLSFLIRISDIHGDLSEKILKQTTSDIKTLYLECKSMKDQFLKIINNDIKKQHVSNIEKIKKEQLILSNAQKKKTSDPNQVFNLNKLQQENTKFEKESLVQLQTFLETSEKQEQLRTQRLKQYVTDFVEIVNKKFEQTSVLSKKIHENFMKTEIDFDVKRFSMQKDKIINRYNYLNSQQFRDSNSFASSMVMDQTEVKLANNQVQKKQNQLIETIRSKRLKTQNIQFASIVQRSVPAIIMEQEGIFLETIPFCQEIQNQFDTNQLNYIVLALTCNFVSCKKEQFKERDTEFETFQTLVKNKLKIQLKISKIITQNFTASFNKKDSRINPNYFEILLEKATKIDQLDEINQPFISHLMLLVNINEFWSYKLNNIFQHKRIDDADFENKNSKNLECFLEKNQEKLKKYMKQFPIKTKITFPLNYVISEILLTLLFEQNNEQQLFIEDWLDYFYILHELAKDALNIPSINFYLQFFNCCHQLLYSGLVQRKEKIYHFFKQMSEMIEKACFVMEEFTKIAQKEEGDELNNAVGFKISNKAFKDMFQIMKQFWYYIPIEVLKPVTQYFYCLAIHQKDYTIYKDIDMLLQYVFESCGMTFSINYYKKFEFNPEAQVNKNTLNQIYMLLNELNKDSKVVFNKYLPALAKILSQIKQDSLKNMEILYTIDFLNSMLHDILEVLKLISEEQLVIDNYGEVFTICLELSKFDDIADNILEQRNEQYFSSLDQLLNTWFQKLETEQTNILNQCMKSEIWDDKQQPGKIIKLNTDTVSDYCSLLFKSIEILKQLVNLQSTNKLKQKVQLKIENIAKKCIQDYCKMTINSLNHLKNFEEPNFVKFSGTTQILQKETDEQQLDNCKSFKMLCYRFGNLFFMQEQIEKSLQEIIDNNNEVIKIMLRDLNETLDVISKITGKALVQYYWKNLLSCQLYSNFDVKEFLSKPVDEFQKTYQNSLLNTLQEIDNYFYIIQKRIPSKYFNIICNQIVFYLTKIIMYNMTDINKFSGEGINHMQISKFFHLEIDYFKTYIGAQMPIGTDVGLALGVHSRVLIDLCSYFDTQTLQLIDQFDNLMVQDDLLNSQIIFRVLYIRKKEEINNKRVQQIIQKYKKLFLGIQ